jgi:hypothetical protein
MPVGTSKSLSLILCLKLFTNEPLDKPIGMDDENLLPCGCEWKLVAVELLVKYRVNALLIYNQNGEGVGNDRVSYIIFNSSIKNS